jgi:membrane protease YdiL (CAAX protease family)
VGLEEETRNDRRTPPAAALRVSRRTLVEEVLVVLSLSLLASAVYAIISLASAPISGVTAIVYPQVGLATQLANIVFGVAPAALVLHLARRSGEGLRPFGLDGSRIWQDAGLGLGLAAVVGAVGIAIYLGSLVLKVNRFVIPVPPLGQWWTVPILVLGATQAALLEEVVVVGYLIRRLEQVGWPGLAALGGSALLRASYHLYQGWGGFAGNLALGLLFGGLYLKRRRTWPLVGAHALVDILAGVGYIVFRGHCFGSACIR